MFNEEFQLALFSFYKILEHHSVILDYIFGFAGSKVKVLCLLLQKGALLHLVLKAWVFTIDYCKKGV